MRLFPLILLIAALSGCATPPKPPVTPITAKSESVNLPLVGTITTAELGQALIDRGRVYYFLVADLKLPVTAKLSYAESNFMEPQILQAVAEDSRWTYYRALKITAKNIGDFGMVRNYAGIDGGLRVAKEGAAVEYYLHGRGLFYIPLDPAPALEIRKVTAVDRPSFRQELIYNGRVKDSLKFLYRELSSDIMRPAFTQDIQYDISTSNMVGFKGARLEVLEATNEMIRYKLITPFPEDDRTRR